MRKLLIVLAILSMTIATTATNASANQLLPKHHKLSHLTLKSQANWYERNIRHAKSSLRFWKRASHEHSFTKIKGFKKIAKKDVRYHTRLLERAEAKVDRIERILHPPAPSIPHLSAWLCIHRFEGSWTDSGAPYYGGLQMDWSFMNSYGGGLLYTKGTADHWTPEEQMLAGERALRAGRGFYPWPNTARYCGLI